MSFTLREHKLLNVILYDISPELSLSDNLCNIHDIAPFLFPFAVIENHNAFFTFNLPSAKFGKLTDRSGRKGHGIPWKVVSLKLVSLGLIKYNYGTVFHTSGKFDRRRYALS